MELDKYMAGEAKKLTAVKFRRNSFHIGRHLGVKKIKQELVQNGEVHYSVEVNKHFDLQ